MKKKIIVTGGAGFIGSFLVDELVDKGHTVKILDNLEEQVHQGIYPSYVNKNAEFIKADVRNYGEIKDHVMDADVVVNFAAMVGVGQSMYKIKEYVHTNSLGTANILHVLANEEHSVKKVLVASSMSIYGEGSYYCEKCGHEHHNIERSWEKAQKGEWNIMCPDCKEVIVPIPTKETKPLSSSSIYAISKKNQEEMTLNVGQAYGIPSVALRFFNTYGPRQSLSNPYTGVAAIFMSRIKNKNPPMIFEDGEQGRDFVSVHDIVQGCVLAIEKNAANNEIFNIGTGKKTSIRQVAENIIDAFKSDIKPSLNNQYRKGDIRHCYADISKIKSKLDYEPKISLKDGMQELVDWSLNQDSRDMVDIAFNELKNKKLI
jgi:dTDP-L-rhamnose 4-epimerase